MSLTLECVSHRYGNLAVLRDVDLHIRDGDRLAFMGPSGSGKSTLLAILGLLLDPTSGIVLINGRPAPARERLRHQCRVRNFGWILQTMNMLPLRTARENVAIALLPFGASLANARARAADALELVGLADKVEVPVRNLSGGEVQRVGIARAITPSPTFVLADEPTGQLDEETSIRVIAALAAVLDSTKATLVVATHDPLVAESCNRVFGLRNGSLVPR